MRDAVSFHQIRIGLAHPPTSREIELRYRCIEARHEGVLYNADADATWCLCGRAVRVGDHGRFPSPYERAESAVGRTDGVGNAARRYLAWVHDARRGAVPTVSLGRGGEVRSVASLMGEPEPALGVVEPPTVPTPVGDQYVLEVL